MIIWNDLKIKNSSNTLTITPTQVKGALTFANNLTFNGELTCKDIKYPNGSTPTAKFYDVYIARNLGFANTGEFKITAGSVSYPNDSWSEDNVISYKNCDIGYKFGIKHIPNSKRHWYLELGPGVAAFTDGTSIFERLRLYRDSESINSLGIALRMGTDADSSGDLEVCRWDGSAFAGFKASTILASVKVEAPTFNTTSDKRLKTNIQPWQPEKSILDLPICSFDYIADGSHHIGCLAQDVQKICPELVHEGADGYLHIEESKLIYLLIQEVRNLKQQIQLLME